MKKKLGLFNRIMYWINLVVAFLLVVSFVLPFIPPKSFPTISLLSLVVSPLIILNLLFVLYWLLKLKRKIVYSLTLLVIAHFHFGSFFQYSSDENISETENSLTILSFNVRLFNAYEEKPQPKVVAETFSNIITTQHPDVVCIQEYYAKNEVDFSAYPYQYIYFRGKAELG
ncbi:MAG: endonuclease, partial [Bacteroidetes bacterium]|nr:endonuclease [Bacteroidota bacterium]